MFIAGVQRLENTLVVTARIKAFAWFFSVCYGNETVGTTTKDLDGPEVQRCAGEGEGGGTSSPLQGCARGAKPCRALLLLLCLQTLTLSPKHNTVSAPGRLSSRM